MSGWQLVTFYTTGTGYESEVKNLARSAEAFGIPIHVYAYPPRGTWRENLDYKSACIMRAFDEFPDKDIVFLDADAMIRKNPELFDRLSAERKYDMSACFYSYTPRSGDKDELLSGTLWIQNGERGRALVRRWHEIGLRRPDVRHQMCLKLAIVELQDEGVPVNIFRHPFSYTCIFDYFRARGGDDPVIEHFQASRRLRRAVGYGPPLLPHAAQSVISDGIVRKRVERKRAHVENIDNVRRHFAHRPVVRSK